jgi:hypothetical protein
MENFEMNSQTMLVAGAVAALAAGAILTAVFVFRLVGRQQAQRDGNNNNASSASMSMAANAEEKTLDMIREREREREREHEHDVISEIGMQIAYEVSTLGDPHGCTAPDEESQQDEEKTNESFILDYDYQKAHYKYYSDGSVSDGTGTQKSLLVLSTDDETCGGQYDSSGGVFEVRAPPGKLGLVLATTDEGVPVVNSVKSTSVLRDEVQVGDRLVSVDGIDVLLMLATDVSQIIASKQHKAERLFVFCRPTRKDYRVDSLPCF